MKRLLPALLFAATSFAAAPPPNVLVILADDMGYADLGCQGSAEVKTPHIDSIARNGVRFTSGYVTSPVCSPSRAGLLTGRNGVRYGIELNPGFSKTIGLPLSEKTLAERLKPAGYATGIIGKWHLGFPAKMQPTARGFDEFYGFLAGAHSYLEVVDGKGGDNPIQRGREKVDTIGYLTEDLGREAVSFIERNREKPWLLYLAFNAPHGPFEVPDPYKARFQDLAAPRQVLAGMIAAMDDQVGQVLAKLREHGLEENTLVVFLSDNGAPNKGGSAQSNHPFRGYKAELTEGGIRVPFLVQWKGRIPGGRTDGTPVTALDIMPTALAAAAVAMPDNLDGANLLALLTRETEALPDRILTWKYHGQRALRSGNWKLLGRGGQGALYDLSTDPGERKNLAAEQPDRLKELEALWRKWDDSLPGRGREKGRATEPEDAPGEE